MRTTYNIYSKIHTAYSNPYLWEQIPETADYMSEDDVSITIHVMYYHGGGEAQAESLSPHSAHSFIQGCPSPQCIQVLRITLPDSLYLAGHLVMFKRATLQVQPALFPRLDRKTITCCFFLSHSSLY